MDLDCIEALNEVRSSVYRVSLKLQALQKVCHLDLVSVRHITSALCLVGGATLQQEVRLKRQEVTQTLNRMFNSLSQEVPGHVNAEETCSLLFRLYDRSQSGDISAFSLQTALIALSAETLQLKYRALVTLSGNGSGSVSRSGLRCLLDDLSQVLAAVQEDGVFGGVEAALKSCFNGVMTSAVSEEHLILWLQGEPRLLQWLPTLYRLSVSQNVHHSVRCHTCRAAPITGLRYRCMKCVNVNVCQSCFLTERRTRKHKAHHPVLEFCTKPTWRESLSSLVHSARHALLPQRYTQSKADRNQALMWAKPGGTRDRAPPPPDSSPRLAASAVRRSPSPERAVSHDASGQPRSPSLSSKGRQTEEGTPEQGALVLLADIRNLQRGKKLLEQQLQAWRLTVQSEHGVLEDRCAEIEVTMETLREHHLSLQSMFSQALNTMKAQQQANCTPCSIDTQAGSLHSSTEEDELSEEEQHTASPIMHQDTPLSHDTHCEEQESKGEGCLCCSIRQQGEPEEAGLQEKDPDLSKEEHKVCGMCSPEELLQEAVERLKREMETDREGHTGDRRRAELVEAAEQVGQVMEHLVDTVRTREGI